MGKGVKPGRRRTGTVGNNEPPFGGEVEFEFAGSNRLLTIGREGQVELG